MSRMIRSIGVAFACLAYMFLVLFLGWLLGQRPEAAYTVIMVLYFLLGGSVIMACSIINLAARRCVLGEAKFALILVLSIACARIAFPDTLYRFGNYLWHVPLPKIVTIIRLPLLVLITGGHPSTDNEAKWLGHEIGAAFLPLLVFLVWFLLSRSRRKRTNAPVAPQPQF